LMPAQVISSEKESKNNGRQKATAPRD
jgi:hypothetical protein